MRLDIKIMCGYDWIGWERTEFTRQEEKTNRTTLKVRYAFLYREPL